MRSSRNNLLVVVAAVVTVACSVFAIGRAAATGGRSSGVPPTGSAGPVTSAQPPGSAGTVQVVDFAFAPATLSVKVGTTVTWTNADAFAHSIRSNDGAFVEQTMAKGATATAIFAKAGTYAYICGIHNSMTGTVVVAP